MTKLSEFLGPSSRVLVISACSAKKATSDLAPEAQLTARELDDPILRAEGEARLARYAKAARALYVGQGHKYVLHGIERLRREGYEVFHYILSAGYGFVADDETIVPYNVTFSGSAKESIRQRGRRLALAERFVEVATGFEKVIVILGCEYLMAIGLPLPAGKLPPTLLYVAPALQERVGDGMFTIVIGEAERRRMAAYSASAKEKRFWMDSEQVSKASA